VSFTSYKLIITLLLRNIKISTPKLSLRSFKRVNFSSFLLGGLFITTWQLLPKVTNFRDLVYNIIEGVKELSWDKLLLLGLFRIYTLFSESTSNTISSLLKLGLGIINILGKYNYIL
jgi:hypothetical protein